MSLEILLNVVINSLPLFLILPYFIDNSLLGLVILPYAVGQGIIIALILHLSCYSRVSTIQIAAYLIQKLARNDLKAKKSAMFLYLPQCLWIIQSGEVSGNT